MPAFPETILQFGAGRFLRGFVDRFVQNANDAGQAVGDVVIVQSTAGARAEGLNQQRDGYAVLIRGYEDGQLVERTERIHCIRRALTAGQHWQEVLEVARAPALRFVVSNATEAGYAVEPGDQLDAAPPPSLPGKLTQVLWQRFQAGAPPITLLPTELIERNAEKLLALVIALAQQWRLPDAFLSWMRDQCVWLPSLVDCIITNVPADHALSKQEPMAVHAEPYALWAIEKPASRTVTLFEHPAIHVVDDLAPYYLRKVRMLNGLHTAMVSKFLPAGFETVQQILNDKKATRWVRDLLFEEMVPTLAYRLDLVAAFADETFDRFRNPFLRHLLTDIRLNHVAKVKIRLQPTRDEYEKLFAKAPPRLTEALNYPSDYAKY